MAPIVSCVFLCVFAGYGRSFWGLVVFISVYSGNWSSFLVPDGKVFYVHWKPGGSSAREKTLILPGLDLLGRIRRKRGSEESTWISRNVVVIP